MSPSPPSADRWQRVKQLTADALERADGALMASLRKRLRDVAGRMAQR